MPGNTMQTADAARSNDLRFALSDWAEALAAEVNAAISVEMKSAHSSPAAIRRTVSKLMPTLLLDSFVLRLAGNARNSRKQRAMLIQLLSAADIGVTRAPQRAARTEPSDETLLTSEQAAALLQVSRTHTNSLIDSGNLGPVIRTAGRHRRIPESAVVAYKARRKEQQSLGLNAMTLASKRLGLYKDELQGIPRRSKRP